MRSSPREIVLAELDRHGPTGWPGNDPRPCECDPDTNYENGHIAAAVVDALQGGGYVVMSDDALARTVTHTLTIEKQFANGPKVPAATLVSNLGLVRTTLLNSIEECSEVARGA